MKETIAIVAIFIAQLITSAIVVLVAIHKAYWNGRRTSAILIRSMSLPNDEYQPYEVAEMCALVAETKTPIK